MKMISLTILVMFSILTTTIVHARPKLNAKDSNSNQNESPIETRVYVRKQCLVSETKLKVGQELGLELASIFVPILIKKAIGGLSSALKKAGKPKPLSDSGRYPTHLYQISGESSTGANGETTIKKKLSLNPQLGCVIIVRGKFDGFDDPKKQTLIGLTQDEVKIPETSAELNNKIQILKASGIPVKEIALLYEAEIKKSDDITALYYEGRFLGINSFQNSKSSKSRNLVISIAIKTPGSEDGKQANLSLALMNLGQVNTDLILGPQKMKNIRSGWLNGIGVTEEYTNTLGKMEVTDGKKVGFMPVTVVGEIIETENENKALLFIAEILSETKDEVTTKLSAEILKDRKKEAETEANEKAAKIEQLLADEEKAYPEYLQAILDLNEAGIAIYPVPSDIQPTIAQQIKIAKVQEKQRAWCGKYKALLELGVTVNRSRTPDCQ